MFPACSPRVSTCLPRVYHVSTTCSPRVHHVFTTCSPACSLRVHHVFTTCLPRVHHVFTTCSPRDHHVFTTCTPRVFYVFTTCSPRVYHVFTTWSLTETTFTLSGTKHEHSNATVQLQQVSKLTPSRCHVMNSRALLIRPRGAEAGTLTLPCYEQQNTAEKTKRYPRLLVYSWSIPGALLVHSWCTPGALPVHFQCTSGALSVQSKGFPKGNRFAPERKP